MFFEYVQRRACACVKAADAVGPSPCMAANMPPPRARNTASAKDLVKCFRSHFKDLDPAAFRQDVEEVIAQYEGLLADIMDETVRPSESVLRDGLVRSYDVSGKDARAVARDISACFKHLRSKLQSSSSGKKLTPSVWRLVLKLTQLTGQGAPQKAMEPMKEREPVETPGAAQALPAGGPAPYKPSRRYRLFCAGRAASKVARSSCAWPGLILQEVSL